MIDEGYTRFIVDWPDRAPIADAAVAELDRWRKPLFDAGVIGIYENSGISYGNISKREPGERQFIISGTQTGRLASTGREHYACVTDYDIDANRVSCRGAVQASSESMTHAAIYDLDASICAVIHVHDLAVWEALIRSGPATRADVPYGTSEMAREFARLYRETAFAGTGVAAMAGHESGIVSIGKTLPEAANRLLELHDSQSVRHARPLITALEVIR